MAVFRPAGVRAGVPDQYRGARRHGVEARAFAEAVLDLVEKAGRRVAPGSRCGPVVPAQGHGTGNIPAEGAWEGGSWKLTKLRKEPVDVVAVDDQILQLFGHGCVQRDLVHPPSLGPVGSERPGAEGSLWRGQQFRMV